MKWTKNLMIELPHTDDMTVRNFYKHLGLRHPIPELDWETHSVVNHHDNGAYKATLRYHDRLHEIAIVGQYDHTHADESELTE